MLIFQILQSIEGAFLRLIIVEQHKLSRLQQQMARSKQGYRRTSLLRLAKLSVWSLTGEPPTPLFKAATRSFQASSATIVAESQEKIPIQSNRVGSAPHRPKLTETIPLSNVAIAYSSLFAFFPSCKMATILPIIIFMSSMFDWPIEWCIEIGELRTT
mmetsp:Transcript_11639/g.19359  ORF Transcript_11639/g.19359 Transcript_11639/m.19359 type:complete len:158 (-) Transcript_11639:333-806(-)